MDNIIKNNNEDIAIATTGRLKELEIEIFTIGEQVQNSFIDMGKRIFEAKKLCKEQNISYEEWCEKNIGMHHHNCNRIIRVYEVFSLNPTLTSKIGSAGFMDGKNSFRKLDALAMLSEPVKEFDTSKGQSKIARNDDGSRKFDVSEIEKFLADNPQMMDKPLKELREEITRVKESKNDMEKNLKDRLHHAQIAMTNAETQNKRLTDMLEKFNKEKDEIVDKSLKERTIKLEQEMSKERQKLNDLMARYSKMNEAADEKLKSAKQKEEELKEHHKLVQDTQYRLEDLKREIATLANSKDDIVAGANRIDEIKTLLSHINEVVTLVNKFDLPSYDGYFEQDSNLYKFLQEGYDLLEITTNKLKNRLNNTSVFNNAINIDYKDVK